MIYTLFIQQILFTECLQCIRQHSGPGIQPLPFGAYSQGRRYSSHFQVADAIMIANAGKAQDATECAAGASLETGREGGPEDEVFDVSWPSSLKGTWYVGRRRSQTEERHGEDPEASGGVQCGEFQKWQGTHKAGKLRASSLCICYVFVQSTSSLPPSLPLSLSFFPQVQDKALHLQLITSMNLILDPASFTHKVRRLQHPCLLPAAKEVVRGEKMELIISYREPVEIEKGSEGQM